MVTPIPSLTPSVTPPVASGVGVSAEVFDPHSVDNITNFFSKKLLSLRDEMPVGDELDEMMEKYEAYCREQEARNGLLESFNKARVKKKVLYLRDTIDTDRETMEDFIFDLQKKGKVLLTNPLDKSGPKLVFNNPIAPIFSGKGGISDSGPKKGYTEHLIEESEKINEAKTGAEVFYNGELYMEGVRSIQNALEEEYNLKPDNIPALISQVSANEHVPDGLADSLSSYESTLAALDSSHERFLSIPIEDLEAYKTEHKELVRLSGTMLSTLIQASHYKAAMNEDMKGVSSMEFIKGALASAYVLTLGKGVTDKVMSRHKDAFTREWSGIGKVKFYPKTGLGDLVRGGRADGAKGVKNAFVDRWPNMLIWTVAIADQTKYDYLPGRGLHVLANVAKRDYNFWGNVLGLPITLLGDRGGALDQLNNAGRAFAFIEPLKSDIHGGLTIDEIVDYLKDDELITALEMIDEGKGDALYNDPKYSGLRDKVIRTSHLIEIGAMGTIEGKGLRREEDKQVTKEGYRRHIKSSIFHNFEQGFAKHDKSGKSFNETMAARFGGMTDKYMAQRRYEYKLNVAKNKPEELEKTFNPFRDINLDLDEFGITRHVDRHNEERYSKTPFNLIASNLSVSKVIYMGLMWSHAFTGIRVLSSKLGFSKITKFFTQLFTNPSASFATLFSGRLTKRGPEGDPSKKDPPGSLKKRLSLRERNKMFGDKVVITEGVLPHKIRPEKLVKKVPLTEILKAFDKKGFTFGSTLGGKSFDKDLKIPREELGRFERLLCDKKLDKTDSYVDIEDPGPVSVTDLYDALMEDLALCSNPEVKIGEERQRRFRDGHEQMKTLAGLAADEDAKEVTISVEIEGKSAVKYKIDCGKKATANKKSIEKWGKQKTNDKRYKKSKSNIICTAVAEGDDITDKTSSDLAIGFDVDNGYWTVYHGSGEQKEVTNITVAR